MANINLGGTLHNEPKIITDRIAILEKHLGDLCQNFGKVARKNAALRDTGDSIVTSILEYVGKEKINTSSINGLKNYATYLSAVEDYRNAMIERVENKVIQPISKYDEFLRTCKSTIKSTLAFRDKEKKKQLQLNAILQKTPDNGRNIAQAEATVESARQKVAAQDKTLTEQIDKLEDKKLNDMKNILKEYTHIQIVYHAKALEMLTLAYQHILDIDCDNDLEEFRNTFRQKDMRDFIGSKMSLAASNYEQQSMMNTTGGSLPVTPQRSRAANNNHSRGAQLANNNQQSGLSRKTKSNENLKRQEDHSPISSSRTPRGGKTIYNDKQSKLNVEDYSTESEDED